MERDKSTIFMSLSGVNFNSHAHVERDVKPLSFRQSGTISTHTLTWSVTGYYYDYFNCKPDFNSHAHVERDKFLDDARTYKIISTHTLTWSVTQ